MVKIDIAEARRTINELCVNILEPLGYDIDEESKNQKIHFHLGLIITSVGMFILSLVSLAKDVGWLAFTFHIVSMFYKLLVLQTQKQVAKLEAKQEIVGAASSSLNYRVSSPYHTQFVIMVTIFISLVIVMIATILYSGDSGWLFYTVTLFSTVISLVKDILDGLVSLYNAHGTGHYIPKRKHG